MSVLDRQLLAEVADRAGVVDLAGVVDPLFWVLLLPWLWPWL